MTTAIFGMLPVSIPRFASSNAFNNSGQNAPPQSGGGQAPAWIGDGADHLDFDLLAEYLLDDGMATIDPMGIPGFDFNTESAPTSGLVSPEQSEDGIPSIGTAGNRSSITQVQNIIAAHAASQANHQTLAPGSMPLPPALHHPGMQVVAGGGGYQTMSTPAPAPIAASTGMVLHQHGNTASTMALGGKRRRVDAPVMASASSMNAHLMAQAMQNRGRQKSQAQIDRRRERNRILARRTRLRKKFFFESLQKDVMDLQRENVALKEIVKTKMDPEAAKILLDGCNAIDLLPSGIAEACGEDGFGMDQQDFNLIKSIQQSQQCFIITDPSLQDNPIVYASDDFLALTGYAREEVLGRNCRFLQGTETSTAKLEQVRKAVSNGDDVSVTMINYTADGTAFWNKLFIAALRDAQNNIVNFIGVIVKVASPEPSDPEAGKRLPGEQFRADEDDMDYEDDADGTMSAMEGAVSAALVGNGSP